MSKEIKDIPPQELERIQLTAERVAENAPDLTEMSMGIYIDGYQNGAKAEYLRHLSPAVQQEDGEVPEDIQAFINAQTREIIEGEDMLNFPADGLVKIAIAMYRKMQLSAKEKETKNAIRWVLENTHGRTVADLEETYSQYLQSLAGSKPPTNE